MRKKFYIIFIIFFAIVAISTAFIPRQKDNIVKDNTELSTSRTALVHPEAGYIEEIGK